jgi:hypothetical protein
MALLPPKLLCAEIIPYAYFSTSAAILRQKGIGVLCSCYRNDFVNRSIILKYWLAAQIVGDKPSFIKGGSTTLHFLGFLYILIPIASLDGKIDDYFNQ